MRLNPFKKDVQPRETDEDMLYRGRALIAQHVGSARTMRLNNEAQAEQARQQLKQMLRQGDETGAKRVASKVSWAKQQVSWSVNIEDRVQRMADMLDRALQQSKHMKLTAEVSDTMAKLNFMGQEEANKIMQEYSVQQQRIQEQFEKSDNMFKQSEEPFGDAQPDANVESILQEMRSELQAEAQAETDLERRAGLASEEERQ